MCLLPDTRNIILRYYYLFFSLLVVWSDVYADAFECLNSQTVVVLTWNLY